ncbi:MAG: hypothetical protein JKY81_04560 [Colwellia sp.]|nr:hypothetical protein [Colwellia sp.]
MSTFNLVNIHVTGYMDDVSTAGQIYIPISDETAGEVIEIRSALNGAIITADAVITPKIGGTSMTNGVLTITQSGSAAGDTDLSRPTGARTVAAGDAIELETSGASGNAVSVHFVITIKR